jgi:hypothetical protein
MSYWKKIISLFLIALIVAPVTLPAITFAQLTSASAGSTITGCPPGEQPDASGKNCAPVSIPTTTVGSPTSGPCANLSGTALTRCQNAQAANPTLRQFQPNVNISKGNTYGGLSISGVGGAIASCTNVGSFLINGAASLLSHIPFVKKYTAMFSAGSDSNSVATSDEKAQNQLKAQTKISQCLDGVAYAVAKNTLAQVTNKTLNWVNTGLNGNPLYVQNTSSYLNSIKNQQLNSFLGTVQTTDPIFGNALRSAIRQQATGKSDGLLNVALDTPQAQGYNSFMHDFTSGGWNALLNPSYNPIGAFFNATDTLTSNINTSQQTASSEIQRGNGFLDMKHCVETAPLPEGVNAADAAKIGLTVNPECTKWVTDTPGSIIANQVATITTSPTRQLEYANKINEVLGSFFDSFVNSLLQKGLRGSGPANEKLNFGLNAGGDNTVIDTSKGITNEASLAYQSSASGGFNTGDFDISRPQQLHAVIQTQKDFLNRTLDAQIALDRIIPAIGALDYCIPGPNPDFQNGIQSNWQTFMSSIQQANPKDQSTVEKLVGDLPIVGSLIGGIVGLFTGAGSPPALWSANTVLSDKVTGSNLQINRTFYAPRGHSDDLKTSDLTGTLSGAYQTLMDQNNYYNTKGSSFDGSHVGAAFKQAAAGDPDPAYVDGFLQDSYVVTASIIGYNKSAGAIDQQYNQNTTDTQNDIKQLEDIRKKVNTIVATAKARYIAERAAAGDPVNLQCINDAYKIDNSPITGVPQQEPRGTTLSNEEDVMVQHATDSSSYFYTNQIK